ncbi:MAG: hypothetical protein ABSA92_12925 [Candidatus Bathyarchaeia archaeon]
MNRSVAAFDKSHMPKLESLTYKELVKHRDKILAPSVTRRMYSCGSHGHAVRLAPLTVTQEQIEARFTERVKSR